MDLPRQYRKSIRLKNYDYSQAGLYFITICMYNKACLFGEIVGAGSKPAHVDDVGLSRSSLAPARAGLEPAPTDSEPVRMMKNEYGQIVEDTWFDLVNHVFNIELHEFIVMPNHIHGIIEIQHIEKNDNNNDQPVGAGSKPALADVTDLPRRGYSLAEMVRQLKTFSAKRINKLRNTADTAVWQRNYYEHIIRNEASY